MEEFKYKHDELWCESTSLREIARAVGTPAYIYSRRSILDHYRWIERALSGFDHLSCYAVKANANETILRLLASEGIGADVGSIGEMKLALHAGFPPDKITFSGVGKRDDEIAFALSRNIMSLNVESEHELAVVHRIASENGQVARVLLRVNFDIMSETHPYITTGRKHNKFGLDPVKARELIRGMKQFPSVRFLGVHSHIGSQITRSDTFVSAARAMVEFIRELRSEGIETRELNFGGGFGVQYRGFVSHPLLPPEPEGGEMHLSTVKLLEAVLPELRKAECRILIQPGRSIIAHAGILLTKILYRKVSDSRTFLIVDAGMNDLIRPSLYQSYHQIVPLELRDARHETVDIVGPLCESGDFFALDRPMPVCERDEILALLCTGAYGYVLSSNYNGRPRPVEVLVNDDRFETIRPREVIIQ
ncbi:MAG TPA: diaminopimelate decarboxylase [Bacteroidota bacterium]|nr:diaminopimelate decarboxylase [Bacteroidota bacterium]